MRFDINWTAAADGAHSGGISNGDGFTISWQRGPCSVEADRNGAFVTEVLADAIRYCRHSDSIWSGSGIGFTILWSPVTVGAVVQAMAARLTYYQECGRFACPENQRTIAYLKTPGCFLDMADYVDKILDPALAILATRPDCLEGN